jgi:hypothetical protein
MCNASGKSLLSHTAMSQPLKCEWREIDQAPKPLKSTIKNHDLASASGDFEPNDAINIFRAFRLHWNGDSTSRYYENSTTKPRKLPKSWFGILAPKPCATRRPVIGCVSLRMAANMSKMHDNQDDPLIVYFTREFRSRKRKGQPHRFNGWPRSSPQLHQLFSKS